MLIVFTINVIKIFLLRNDESKMKQNDNKTVITITFNSNYEKKNMNNFFHLLRFVFVI